MDRRRMLLGEGFPKEPSAYEIISTYTKDDVFTAPKNGWYQIEVFGASGNGGEPYNFNGRVTADEIYHYTLTSAGGGGGGGYACSRVKMKKGDTAKLFPRGIGETSSIVMIYSSLEEYKNMVVTSGGNGTRTTVGTGGVASGGNYENANGKNGNRESVSGTMATGGGVYAVVKGAGGAAGYSEGNAGGNGEGCVYDTKQSIDDVLTAIPATKGSAGFIKIYKGK